MSWLEAASLNLDARISACTSAYDYNHHNHRLMRMTTTEDSTMIMETRGSTLKILDDSTLTQRLPSAFTSGKKIRNLLRNFTKRRLSSDIRRLCPKTPSHLRQPPKQFLGFGSFSDLFSRIVPFCLHGAAFLLTVGRFQGFNYSKAYLLTIATTF